MKTLSAYHSLIKDTLSYLRNTAWLSSFLLLWVCSILFMSLLDSNLWFSLPIFLWGSLTGLAFFFILQLYTSLFPTAFKRVLAFIISAFLLLTVISNFLIFKEFGQFINASMFTFILKDTHYIHDYFRTYLLSPYSLALIAAFYLLYKLWLPSNQKPKKFSAKKLGIAIFLNLLLIVNCDSIRKTATLYQIPLTAATITGMIETTVNSFSHRTLVYPLHKGKRIPVTATNNSDLPNILIVLHESMSKVQGLPFYGHNENAMPFFTQFLQENTEECFIFEHAFTNSTATDVSVPSLFTGVGPHESGSTLHKMPLLWDWAKAAGKDTFLLSSQRFSWGGFDTFLFTEALDQALTADTIDSPVINDLGIDDLIMIKELPKILEKVDPKKGFVGVINSNSLHGPFAQTSTELNTQPNYSRRYLNAEYIIDQTTKELLNTLTPHLENTIIIFTSDHGEKSPFVDHKTHRIYGFYEEYFGIPFVLYVPKKWQSKHPNFIKNLRNNTDKNVQNIDIIPTIAELLTLEKDNISILNHLEGKSLGQEIQNDRPIIALNTNDTRWWHQEGFGIAINENRLVSSTVSGVFFGSIKTDPLQTQNEWKKIDPKTKKSIESIIHKNVYLSRIWKSSLETHQQLY